jgi:hypothetical protein
VVLWVENIPGNIAQHTINKINPVYGKQKRKNFQQNGMVADNQESKENT